MNIIVRFLSVLFIFFCLSHECSAQVSIWDGTASSWTQGDGTESNPYLISSAQNLAYLASQVNSGAYYTNVYFLLTTDLDLQQLPWQPIGGTTYGNNIRMFKGVFDGNNHRVDNLLIPSGRYCGLFGAIGEATIQNLHVKGSVHSNDIQSSAAMIAAYIRNNTDSVPTRILGCSSEGDVSAINTSNFATSSQAGGIIGDVSKCPYLIVSDCYNHATISTASQDDQHVGGIVAYNRFDSGCAFTISNCHNTGDVSATGNYVYAYLGGIVGYVHLKNNESDTSIISNCSNTGHVFSCSNEYTSGVLAGGIVGQVAAYDEAHGTFFIEKCCNTGSIVLLPGWHSAGGIAGVTPSCSYYNIHITNCYNTGNLTSYYSSGIVSSSGWSQHSIPNYVDNCYNAGTLTGHYLGGLIYEGTPLVTNSYYLNNCGGAYPFGTPLADSVMKSMDFPNMLNSDTTVFVLSPDSIVNKGYPIFGNFIPLTMTVAADSVSLSSARMQGYCSVTPDIVGFQYKSLSDTLFTTLFCAPGSHFDLTLNNLASGTDYLFRAFAQVSGSLYYGQMEVFRTLTCDSLQVHIFSTDTIVCSGETVTFSAIATSPYASSFYFVWNTGDTLTSILVSDNNPRIVTVNDNIGCSTSDTFHLTINIPSHTAITEIACEIFTWEGESYNASGDYTYAHTDINGCMQVDTLHLTIYSSEESDFTITTEDSCYIWNTETYCTSGDYTQMLQTIHGCDSLVTLHLTTSVGIEDQHVDVFMSVYPNPITNIVNIQYTNSVQTEMKDIQLYDAYGKLLGVFETNNYSPIQTIQIDMSRFSSGIYFVKAVADNNVLTVRKILKN